MSNSFSEFGLKPATLAATASAPAVEGEDKVVRVSLSNDGQVAALNAKLTLVDGAGKRILPAFYDDNYVALLPGEKRTITIRYPAATAGTAGVTLEGWNVPAATVAAR